MLPRIGNFHGPGGNLLVWLLEFFHFLNKKRNDTKRKREKKLKNCILGGN